MPVVELFNRRSNNSTASQNVVTGGGIFCRKQAANSEQTHQIQSQILSRWLKFSRKTYLIEPLGLSYTSCLSVVNVVWNKFFHWLHQFLLQCISLEVNIFTTTILLDLCLT